MLTKNSLLPLVMIKILNTRSNTKALSSTKVVLKCKQSTQRKTLAQLRIQMRF